MSLEIFPCRKVKWDSTKTPDFETTSVYLGRGRRKSLTNRAYPKWTINVQFTGLNQDEYETIVGFLCKTAGGAFLWQDHEDYRQLNVQIGIADGKTKTFQLVRAWGNAFYEPVSDIDSASLRIYVDGKFINSGYTLADGGKINFTTPPAKGLIHADFSYYWRVALDDSVDFKTLFYNLYETGSLKLISV